MWNVYVVAFGESTRVNTEPYDSEMVAMALDNFDRNNLADVILLVRKRPDAATAEESSESPDAIVNDLAEVATAEHTQVSAEAEASP